MAEKIVDFAAAGRIASRTELRDVRVAEVTATCDPLPRGILEPTLEVDCVVGKRSEVELQVECAYRFNARVGEVPVVTAAIKYVILYDVKGSESLADGDLTEFAVGNGTLHSWPFVREFLHGLTSRMGFPPYTLPVVHFKPKVSPKKEAAAKSSKAADVERSKSKE